MLLPGMGNLQTGASRMRYHFGQCLVWSQSALSFESICNVLTSVWKAVKGMKIDYVDALLLVIGGTLQSGLQMGRTSHYKETRYKGRLSSY
jgi:hypothetical protein